MVQSTAGIETYRWYTRDIEDFERNHSRWDLCQRMYVYPHRFRINFGNDHVSFIETFLMDIMYIDSAPVLHIVDDGTRLRAAQLLPYESTQSLWDKNLLSSGGLTSVQDYRTGF